MKQKNSSPTKEQADILRKNQLNPAEYVVVKVLKQSLIVRHRYSGEHQIAKK